MKLEINDETGRIDVVLSNMLEESRSKIQRKIKDGKVLVNNKEISCNYQVAKGDIIEVLKEEVTSNLEKKEIPLDIVFEDENLLIINKQSGLVVHPAPGHMNDTLVNALLVDYPLTDDLLRPGIVHRLDKDTSGLMLVAKNEETKEALSLMLKKKEVKRTYLALVEGVIKPARGTIDAPIGRDPKDRLKMKVIAGGKEAVTHFKVLKRYQNKTLIECQLDTGRTHQIRVHLAYINHPVVNDPVYGHSKKTTSFGQMLHSYKIELVEPLTKEHLEFTKEPPKEFQDELASLEN
ncbi:MAG: RluA family pseudouridine synthase [bacterium]|jgi:pseudouridine synthase, rluA family|nr:RluA family pseudouridine synthase [bacterium]